MTKEKIMKLYDESSNGIIRPELAAIWLSEVCETALELFKTVEQQNVRLEKYKRTRPKDYVP